MLCLCLFFFFFKQKTAYDMRISDWSSDVCSSDLMPNSSHGGGISRKISSASDRKRLKQIVSDLVLPKSMGLIVRTAGLSRTKPEIKRDFDYLADRKSTRLNSSH